MNRPASTTDLAGKPDDEPLIQAKLAGESDRSASEGEPLIRAVLVQSSSVPQSAVPVASAPNSAEYTGPNSAEHAGLPTEVSGAAIGESSHDRPSTSHGHRSKRRRLLDGILWFVSGTFSLASLIVLLAFLAAIPVVQLITLGYLVDVSGRLINGAKLKDGLLNLHRAGTIGLAVLAVFIAALPSQLLAHWEFVAQTIDPGSNQAVMLRAAAITMSLLAMVYLMWAWIRGGELRRYLWPQPKRFVQEAWRPSTWSGAADRMWEFTASLQLPRLFWLGLRCAAGTMIWLIPAILIIVLNRNGRNGLAGLAAVVSLAALGVSLLYLPMLQAHFASQNRLSALFEVRAIRRDFRRAPWAWLGAMFVSLVLTPIPLYLLKIEATPREAVWLPCLLFVTFMLPARIATGAALRRARRKPEPSGRWAFASRWIARSLMLSVVGVYLVFLYVSQYTSWDGLQTWIQQHAILVPLPFYGI